MRTQRNNNYHVLPRNDGWAVKKEGASRASRVAQNKQKALAYARNVAADKANVFVHRTDGTVQEVVAARGSKRIPDDRIQTKERVHVVPTDSGWGVRQENRRQLAKRFKSKYGAIRYAHGIADRNGSSMVVHAPTGEIDHIDIPPHYRSPISATLHLRGGM